MSSEEADHVSPWEVTPTVGKGTLGTWRFPTSAWVSGLIKPVQSPEAVLETRLWANHGVRVYANQRLSLGEEGKAYGGKAKTSNRTGEIPPSGIIGGHGKRRHGGNENPSCNRKSRNGNPHLKRGAPRALSQPLRIEPISRSAYGFCQGLRAICATAHAAMGAIHRSCWAVSPGHCPSFANTDSWRDLSLRHFECSFSRM
jgi:hypothetical protein